MQMGSKKFPQKTKGSTFHYSMSNVKMQGIDKRAFLSSAIMIIAEFLAGLPSLLL
jgi:hypothetical protein